MKIAILGDTHFGCRGDSLHFHKHFEQFYTEVFIPYLIQNQIKIVFQLGDLFDRRKYINFYTLYEIKRYFFKALKDNDITIYTLLGNHDLYWKESLSVSSTNLLLNEFDNLHIIDRPKEFLDFGFCVIPWICKENQEECKRFMESSKAHTCLGHFEISGFSMYKGVQAHEGMDSSTFYKFEQILTGHFHHRSTKGNVTYVGTPYEMTWQDYGDTKGFHIFDTDNRSLTFIENPLKMYYKINYDDNGVVDTNCSLLDSEFLSSFTEKYIKVIVVNKSNPYLFDTFISALQSVNPIDITIIEDMAEIMEEDDLDSVDEAEDTLTILGKYIDNIKVSDIEPNKVKFLMKDLYDQAMSMETI